MHWSDQSYVSTMDDRDSGLAEEIEILEAIYIHELEVQRDERNDVKQLVLQLHPSTGDDVEQQFVCMTLVLDLPSKYPDEPPDIVIKNPRGIAEEEVQSLREDMHTLCEERLGGPVLYELIELAKESLTAGNIPHCPCMICLEHFHEGEQVCKTTCYHYFHGTCLARYVKHTLADHDEQQGHNTQALHVVLKPSKLLCPVCREEINPSIDELPETPVEGAFNFQPSAELKEQQKKMAKMLERQKAQGGVIDVEAEKNKYLVTNDVVMLATPANQVREASKSPRPSDKLDRGAEKHSRSPRSGHVQRKGRGGRSEQVPKSKIDGRNNDARKGENKSMRNAARVNSDTNKLSMESKDVATVKNQESSESLDKTEKQTINNEKSDIERNSNARKCFGRPNFEERNDKDSCHEEKNDLDTERNEVSKDETVDLAKLKSGNRNRKDFKQRRGFGRPPHRDNDVTESSQHLTHSSADDGELGVDKCTEFKTGNKSEMCNNDNGKNDNRYRDRQSGGGTGSGQDTAMKFDGHDKKYRRDEEDKSEMEKEKETVSNRSHHRKGFGRPPHLNDRNGASHREKKEGDDVYDREKLRRNVNDDTDNNDRQSGSHGTDEKDSFVDTKDVKELNRYDSHGHDSQNKSINKGGKHNYTNVHNREKEKNHEGGRRQNGRGGFGRPRQQNEREGGQVRKEELTDCDRTGEIETREESQEKHHEGGRRQNRKGGFGRPHRQNEREGCQERKEELRDCDRTGEIEARDKGQEKHHEGGRRQHRRGGFGRPHQQNEREGGQERKEELRDCDRTGEIEARDKGQAKHHEGARRQHHRGGFGRPRQQNEREGGQKRMEELTDCERNEEIETKEESQEKHHEGGRRQHHRGGFGRPRQQNERERGQTRKKELADCDRNGEIETKEKSPRYADDNSKGRQISSRQDDVFGDKRVPLSKDGKFNRGNDDHVHGSYYSNSSRKYDGNFTDREKVVTRDEGSVSNQRRGFGRPSYSGKSHRESKISSVGDEKNECKFKDDKNESYEREGYKTSPRENKSSSSNSRLSGTGRKFSKNSDDYQSVSKAHDKRSGSDSYKHDQTMSSSSKIKTEYRDHNKDHSRNEGFSDKRELQVGVTDNSKQSSDEGERKSRLPPGFSDSVPPGFHGRRQSNDKVLIPPPGL